VLTEETVTDLKSLKENLEKSQHPITQRWTKEEAAPEAAVPVETVAAAPGWSVPAMSMPAGMPMMPMQFGGGEGVKLSFKNAKISIERIVFKNKEK
jgi:acetyl-CoA decarbonylase/synthase complex subunit beta